MHLIDLRKSYIDPQKIKDAEDIIRSIIDAWVDVYLDAIKDDPSMFRIHYYNLIYSEDEGLKQEWRAFISQEKIKKLKEKRLYEKYETMVRYAKSIQSSVVVFRDTKIVSEWKKYGHLCIGIEDYVKDKEVYRSAIYVDEITHPYLYKYIQWKKHMQNIKQL